MEPGSLNKRLEIVKYELVQNATGGFLKDPQKVVVCKPWGNIRPINGKAYWEAQSERAKITHEITIRYNKNVFRDQFVFYKGRKFVIQHIINTDEKNVELKLHCYEEV